jgi:uncharacterized protein
MPDPVIPLVPVVPSRVLFTDFQESSERNIYAKIDDLLDRLPLSAVVRPGDIVAVKIHFGERGNTSFLQPHFVGHVVAAIKKLGGRPFLTDTNTLYVGSRSDSVAHLETAHQHGFTYETVGCPVIISDGLRGGAWVDVAVDGARHNPVVRLAHDLAKADAIVVLTHFKGHEFAGFGGAIKNLGMGGGSRAAKLAMHSSMKPKIRAKQCEACGRCVEHCPADAIKLGKVAVIDPHLCIGCGSCIVVCPHDAVAISWNSGASGMQERMVEHFAGFVRLKPGRIAYVNFVNRVSPACDCYGFSDRPIVSDQGILASLDPVAIDAASVALVDAAEGHKDSVLKAAFAPGTDKFRDLYPNVDGRLQLRYAEGLGLGQREHVVERVD